MLVSNDLDIVGLIRSSSNILVFTGAGISTSSGIPDYRSEGGFWSRHEPVLYRDFMSSVGARREQWSQDLEIWDKFKGIQPSATHNVIYDLDCAGKLGLVVTQNIDGLHVKAGNSPDKVVEIHGSNSTVECQICGSQHDTETQLNRFSETGHPPECFCGGFLKTSTVIFGQPLVQGEFDRAMGAAYRADLVISLGSTLSVEPANTIPLSASDGGRVPYIIINRGETRHDGLEEVTFRLDGDVDDIFPELVGMAI